MKILKILLTILIFINIYKYSAKAQTIHEAVQKGDLDKICGILEEQPDLVNQPDAGWRRTPLVWAAYSENLDIIKYLLDKGADIHATDGASNKTVLHIFSSLGNKQLVELVIDHGADVNALDNNCCTPLAYAISGNHKEIIELLNSKGAIVPMDGENARNLFHWAASQGNESLTNWMIENEVNLFTENCSGGTFLHSVCEGGLKQLTEYAISEGFNINSKDRYGLTPLHHAVKEDHYSITKILIQNGADINALSAVGKKPIHFANQEHNEIIELLKNSKAYNDELNFPIIKCKYSDPNIPSDKPELFSPGIISSIDWEHSSPNFSPTFDEVFWTSIPNNMLIYTMKFRNGKWTSPTPASFSGKYNEAYPFISNNGKKLYYISYKALEKGKTNQGFGVNMWYVEKCDTGWYNPQPVGYPLNTGNIFGFSISDNGTIYYTDGGGESFCIYKTELIDGNYSKPIKLSDSINSTHAEDEPFIAPDESYIIFKSMRPGGYGAADLYISFQKTDGTWTKANNLGPPINTGYAERFPYISPDSKYFFFGSNRNGNKGDIFWVNTDFIKELKKP